MKETYNAILNLLSDGQARPAVEVSDRLNLPKKEVIKCLAVAAGAEKVAVEYLASTKYYKLAPAKPRPNSAEKVVSYIIKKRRRPEWVPLSRWEEWKMYCKDCGEI